MSFAIKDPVQWARQAGMHSVVLSLIRACLKLAWRRRRGITISLRRWFALFWVEDEEDVVVAVKGQGETMAVAAL